jgi:threonine dehydratase
MLSRCERICDAVFAEQAAKGWYKPPMSITFADIEAARARIAGAVEVTPCRVSRTLSAVTEATLALKFENQQFTGSFKERGARNTLLQLTPEQRARGVIAMSAGNHAQGVAYHARQLGIAATIVMPRGTPYLKIAQTEHFAPRILIEGEGLAGAEDFARELGKQDGLVFVHPYDDEAIIAGQGTLVLEMLEAEPDLDMLVVPVGGGGLISGCAIAAKGVNPDIEVIGVETELYPSMRQALAGEAATSGGATIAEGIAVSRPGSRTLPLVRELVSEVVSVPEAEIERAVLLLLEIEKTVVEGAGAAGLAAILADPKRFAGRRVGLVLSGGNIDSRMLSNIILRGLVREGRLTRAMVEIPDLPGSLADVARIIGDAQANIVDVSHERAFTRMPVKSTALLVVFETRDRAHAEAVLAALGEAGFRAQHVGLPGEVVGLDLGMV